MPLTFSIINENELGLSVMGQFITSSIYSTILRKNYMYFAQSNPTLERTMNGTLQMDPPTTSDYKPGMCSIPTIPLLDASGKCFLTRLPTEQPQKPTRNTTLKLGSNLAKTQRYPSTLLQPPPFIAARRSATLEQFEIEMMSSLNSEGSILQRVR